MWNPLWPSAALACLTSFFLLDSNAESFLLLFHVWSCDFLFMTNPPSVGPHPPLFPHLYPPPPWIASPPSILLCHIFFLCLSFFLSPPLFPPSCPAFYSAAPLTSAGIIPIMQSLCPDGQRDEFGFLQYKNST